MSIADELKKLEELRASGALSESEFDRAKAAALDTSNSTGSRATSNAKETDANSNGLASVLHFSQLLGLVFPVAGFIAPVVIWAIYRNENPALNTHFRIIVNWTVSVLIYLLICGLLAKSFLAAIGLLGFSIIILLYVVFALAGGMKAREGDIWRYPLSIPFLKPVNERI